MLLCAVSLLAATPATKKTPARKDKKVAAPRDYANTLATLQTDMGDITIKFFFDKAPRHVQNFVDLAASGFYDGTMFHRVIPGFMIQGGDPNTKDVNASRSQHGTGGPGYTIKAEFNDTAHKRGVLSMARSTDPNSAGSQFFICVADSGFLDKNYTAFGPVRGAAEAAASTRPGDDKTTRRTAST
jgi:peptidyl-prolyl cis-trans isomerase B (cyclophilin B)